MIICSPAIRDAAALYEKIEKEKARKEREKAAQTEKQRFEAQNGTLEGFSPEEVELDFDDETGSLVTVEEKRQKEEQQREEESPAEERPAEKDNTHKSEAELEAKRAGSTQTFSNLVKNKTYRKQIIETIKAKWSNAPSKVAELEKFLKDKNVEVGSIGTDDASIKAWIRTLKECR